MHKDRIANWETFDSDAFPEAHYITAPLLDDAPRNAAPVVLRELGLTLAAALGAALSINLLLAAFHIA